MEDFAMIVIGMFVGILILAFGMMIGESCYKDEVYTELIKQPNITCMEMLQTLEESEEE